MKGQKTKSMILNWVELQQAVKPFKAPVGWYSVAEIAKILNSNVDATRKKLKVLFEDGRIEGKKYCGDNGKQTMYYKVVGKIE